MAIRWIEVAVTALIAVLLLLVEHYWPWRQLLKKDLHPVTNYVLGTLALNLPLSGLFLWWGLHEALLAMWLTIVLGGVAVCGVYGMDGWIKMRFRASLAEKEGQALRPKVDDDQGTETTRCRSQS